MRLSDTETLTATVAPANATNPTLSWSSSNTAVATVSTAGRITAVGAGIAAITVTTQDGNRTATCTVTVPNLTAVEMRHARPLQVYPNPVVNEELIVNNEELKAGDKIEVYSPSGTLLKTFAATGAKSAIDLSALPAGMYVVKAGNRAAKVVKQ
jgi:transglutaminase/protease-like cytokinesis protein 3